MKKLFIFILILITLTSCGKELEQVVSPVFFTEIVKNGNIEIGENYTAEVKSYNTSTLSIEGSGRVIFIGAKKGEYVKKGQLLMAIETNEIETNLNTINTINENLTTLIDTTAGVYDNQINVLESKKKQLEIGLGGIKDESMDTDIIHKSSIENLKSQISVAENRVYLAETNLNKTINTLSVEEENIYENIKNTITASIILDTTIIDFIDKIIGYTPFSKDKNNEYEIYYGGKDIIKKEKVKNDFISIYSDYLSYKKLYDEKIVLEKYTNEELSNFIKIGLDFNERLRIFLGDFYTVIDNSIENIYLTQKQIDSYKNDVVNFGINIEKLILSVDSGNKGGFKGIVQSLNTFYEEKDKTISILEKTLDIEKSGLESAKITLELNHNIQSSENSKLENNESIKNEQISEIIHNIEALKKEKETKIQSLLIEKDKNIGNKNINSILINNALLHAPYDGIIIEEYSELGSIIMPGSPIFDIANNESIFIEAYIPREGIMGKKTGDIISMRSIGSNPKAGTIHKIDTYLDEKNKNIRVEIIPFDKKDMYLNENIKVFFSTLSATGSVIPNTSIIQKYSIPGVYTLNKNIFSFKNIKIIKQNDYESLIEGLEEGEQVVTEGKENIYDGQIIDNNYKN